MTESGHEPEDQVEALQHDADRLGKDIEATRRDWEAKKADPAVPGAEGDPETAGDGDVPGGDIDTQAPANEDL